MMRARLTAVVAIMAVAGAAVADEARFAFAPYACDGELFSRRETPLILDRMSVRWFNADCTIVGSYKVGDALFLQARCAVEGKVSTIPIMLEPRGERLRVGWDRQPVEEMQRCP